MQKKFRVYIINRDNNEKIFTQDDEISYCRKLIENIKGLSRITTEIMVQEKAS